MRKLIVIESDTDYYSLFAYEVRAVDFAEEYPTKFERVGEKVLAGYNPAVIFGQIRAMLTTKADVEDAEAIVLEEEC